MFENEIEKIMLKHRNSYKLLKNLHKIYDDYDYNGSKKNDIYYLDIRIESLEGLENKTCNCLQNILVRRGLICPYGNWSILKLLKFIENHNINDFYCRMAAQASGYSKEYQFGQMAYKENRVYFQRLNLILDCIYLLENPEPTPLEILDKISNLQGEAFVFRGCKVTLYKNNNLKINFSNPELFKNFKTSFEMALKKVEAQTKAKNA